MKSLTLVITLSLAISIVYGLTAGSDVNCSSDGSTCAGCVPADQTASASSVWTHTTGNNCAITDCEIAVGGALMNANVCASCNGKAGSQQGTGTTFNPVTQKCVADCTSIPKSSIASNVCKCNDPNAADLSKTQTTCGCKAGYYGAASSTSTTGCNTCPSPATGVTATTTVGDFKSCCSADYYGTSTCTQCPSGSKATVNTAATVTDCVPLDTNAVVNASSAIVCKAGFYGTASTTSTTGCTACPASGTGVTATTTPGNNKSCCSANYYGTTTCTACPNSLTAAVNSAAASTDCVAATPTSSSKIVFVLIFAILSLLL